MRWGRILLGLVALFAVASSLYNASWLASLPPGQLVLVAHRGVGQVIDRAAAGAGCGATHVHASDNNFIENTIFSMQNAISMGARGLAVDVRASADGQAMIFRDDDLACRTNGTGRVADHPAAYLRGLDIGYGYSADGGHSFPLRGRGVGGMPIAEEVLQGFSEHILIFELHDARDADAITGAFARAHVPIDAHDGFAGPPAALTHLRQLTQSGWLLDPAASDACLSAYRATGWTGFVPESCRGTTVNIPRRGLWTFWGWPYRFFDRLIGAQARLFIEGDAPEGELVGLEQPEQLGEVPHDYHGLLLIEDMDQVGRALVR